MPERIGPERAGPRALPLDEVATTRGPRFARAPKSSDEPRPGEQQVLHDPNPDVRQNSGRLDVQAAEVAPPGPGERRAGLGQLAAPRERLQPRPREVPVAQDGGAEIQEGHRRVEVGAERLLVRGELPRVESAR